MIAALSGRLSDHTRLLKQVVLDVARGDAALLRELDADELSEARRVVVTHGLCVSERLEHGVRLHDLVLERHLDNEHIY